MLRRYRVAAGLTQEELAERAGLSARGISDLERGVKAVPRRDTVQMLAAALRLTPEQRARFEAARKRGVAPDTVTADSPALAPTRLGALVPPLVGREREVALIERHLDGVGASVLLLAGEPGIGKSRLLREAAQRAAARGWTVLQGGCQRRGGQEPYAPLLDALKGHLRRRSPAELRSDLRGCAWLVRLLPELTGGPIEPLPAWTLPPEQERRLMFEAATRYLENVAGPAGTLLLLDDLQWAGPDALDLLATVVRAATAPLRVVGAYRDTEMQPSDALSVSLADLAQAGLATRRRLAPLAPAEVNRLLDGLLDGAANAAGLREQVVQRTGGVPFFVLSCAQALRLGDADDGGESVPWDVAQGIRQRVAVLPEAAQDVLAVAAVLGRTVEPALLVAVAEQPERALLGALEAATRARLLVEAEAGYEFGHDLIREVVEADVGVARRRMLHRRAAQSLEETQDERLVERLAYHYGRGGEQEKAIRYLEASGDRATGQAAHGAATGYYQEASQRLEGLGRLGEAAGVREKLGAALLTAARFDEAVAALEPAAESYRLSGDREGEGRVTAQIGIAYARRGRPLGGLTRLQPVLERLEAGDPSTGLARLYAALAFLYSWSEQLSKCIVATERASALASALGDDLILAQSEVVRADTLDYLGRIEEALRMLDGAISLVEATGQVFALCSALNTAAHIYVMLGEFARARPYLDRAMAVAERAGEQDWIAFFHFHLGIIAFYIGDWAQARRYGEQADVLFSHIGASSWAGYGSLLIGWVSHGEGRWEEATDYLEQTVRHAESTAYHEAMRAAQSVLAEIEIRQGRPDAARDRLFPLLAEPRPEGRDIAILPPTLAWAHLELGEMDAAERMAHDALAYARDKSMRLNLLEALRVQALVAIRQGRWDGATAALEEGLELARAMPYPYAEGRLLHVYGELHLHKGEQGQARERLEEALAIFQRLGARKDTEQVERDLSGLEAGSP
jgi:tetratricopeptide (TPR) repeat protein/transcriptional regulator with XRE-family HTH domain